MPVPTTAEVPAVLASRMYWWTILEHAAPLPDSMTASPSTMHRCSSWRTSSGMESWVMPWTYSTTSVVIVFSLAMFILRWRVAHKIAVGAL